MVRVGASKTSRLALLWRSISTHGGYLRAAVQRVIGTASVGQTVVGKLPPTLAELVRGNLVVVKYCLKLLLLPSQVFKVGSAADLLCVAKVLLNEADAFLLDFAYINRRNAAFDIVFNPFVDVTWDTEIPSNKGRGLVDPTHLFWYTK